MSQNFKLYAILLFLAVSFVSCERIYHENGNAKTKTNLENQLDVMDRELHSKDEMIAMLKIKTLKEQEEIARQENEAKLLNSQISQLKSKISELETQLAEYKTQINTCQSASCLCKSTDVHDIKVPGHDAFKVSCDSNLAGSGWTVILRRLDGSVNFNRNWREYQVGFGDLRGDFFIGLDKLHLITKSQPHELYIYLESFNNESRYARYDNFLIGDDDASFEITKLGEYSGTAGDGMMHHKNMKFSTFDLDNDNSRRNCADENNSGWWFNNCYHCNLNGPYKSGLYWYPWNRNLLKFVQVMIRPKST